MMADQARVVVIGGGIVGCSVLYGLAKRGWSDSLLLEKLDLTSGSTWHAAGNVTHFGHDTRLTRLYADSIRVYREAEAECGQPIDFHETGSLRLATTREELAAYRELESLYRALDIPYGVVGPDEMARIHPLLALDGIEGAAHTPGDGHVDPSGATHALAKAATARGARIKRFCPVTALAPLVSGGWRLETAEGPVLAEQVVLAASFWARELAATAGLRLPLYPLQHHEIITGPVPEIEALDFELPTLRDPYGPANIRQERSGFLCGVYESDPEFWALDGIPPDFGRELLAPDIGRLEPNLLRVIERLPAFGEAGIKTVNNGPICYTPDGFPLLGPVREQPGLWLAAGFAVGIGTGGGSGEFLAGWMVEGAPPRDLSIVDPARFGPDLDRRTCLARIRETYAEGYVLPAGDRQPIRYLAT